MGPVEDESVGAPRPMRRRILAGATTALLIGGGLVAATIGDAPPAPSTVAAEGGPDGARRSLPPSALPAPEEEPAPSTTLDVAVPVPTSSPPTPPTVPARPRVTVTTTVRLPVPAPTTSAPVAAPSPSMASAGPPCPPPPEPWTVSEVGVYTVATGGGGGRRILPYPTGEGEPQDLTYSPDGRRLALTRWRGSTDGSNETATLHLANVDGSGEREILPATAGPMHLSWSPSGDRLAFRDAGPQPGQVSTWVVDIATEQVHRVAVHDHGAAFIQWSPNGRELAWGGMSGPGGGVWVAAADGSSVRRVDDMATREVSWSPEGTELAVARMGGGIDVMAPDGTRRRRVDPEGIRAAWSPVDRSRLVTDAGGILRWADPDGGPTRFLAHGHLHGWLRSGTGVMATDVEGIHRIDVEGCRRTLVRGSGDHLALRSWSPDDRSVLFVRFR